MKKNTLFILFLLLFLFEVHTVFAEPSIRGSELLKQSISNNTKDRMVATQQLVWDFKKNEKTIDRALTYLNASNDPNLSLMGRINLLYYLSNTSISGWSTDTLNQVHLVLRYLKAKHAQRPQTYGLIRNLDNLVGNFTPVERGRISTNTDVKTLVEKTRTLPIYDKSYALIIGNSHYDNWKKLTSVQKEVEDIESALEKRGFTVDRKSNLSGKEIREAFDNFINQYGFTKNNRLLVYFAGHGDTQSSNDERRGYIIGRDTPTFSQDPHTFKRSAVSMNEIESYAVRIESKHVLFIFDSCFSGSIFEVRGRISHPEPILSYTSRPVRQFITSGSADEVVPGKSDFATYFLRALNYNKADYTGDGYTTGTELGMYLHDKVVGLNKKTQTPQWGKILNSSLDEGDFVFFPTNKK